MLVLTVSKYILYAGAISSASIILHFTRHIDHLYSHGSICATFTGHVVLYCSHYHMETFPLQNICAQFFEKHIRRNYFQTECVPYGNSYSEQINFKKFCNELYKYYLTLYQVYCLWLQTGCTGTTFYKPVSMDIAAIIMIYCLHEPYKHDLMPYEAIYKTEQFNGHSTLTESRKATFQSSPQQLIDTEQNIFSRALNSVFFI